MERLFGPLLPDEEIPKRRVLNPSSVLERLSPYKRSISSLGALLPFLTIWKSTVKFKTRFNLLL